MRCLLVILALVLPVGIVSLPAYAADVVFDFEDLDGSVIFDNYYRSGFRFSPNTHRDAVSGPTGTWLGWDGYADPPHPPFSTSNPNWLGPAALSPFTNGGTRVNEAWMYIDAAGASFTLKSFDAIAYSLEVLSSSGGHVDVSAPGGGGALPVTFTGEQWAGIDWILIRAISPGVPAGLDNLAIEVPEPSTVLLFAASAVFAAAISSASRGKRRRAGRHE